MKTPRSTTNTSIRLALGMYGAAYRRYWWQFLIGISLPAIGTIFGSYLPALVVARIVNRAAEGAAIDAASVTGYLAWFGGLWIFGEILWRIGLHFAIKGEINGIRDLAHSSFALLLERDYSFYSNNFIGSLTKKALAFSRNFETLTDTMLFNIAPNFVPIIFVSIVLWHYSPILPIALISFIVLAIAVAIPLIRRRTKLVVERHKAHSIMSGRLSDVLGNMPAVKAFATEEAEQQAFNKVASNFTQKTKKSWDYQNQRFDIAMSPIYVLANVVGLVLALQVVSSQQLEPGAILIIFTYYAQVTRVVWDITRIYRNIENVVTEAAEFAELVIDKPAIQDSPSASSMNFIDGSIRFQGVNFNYADTNSQDKRSFLNDFNLHIKNGEKVGLVGPSGGGKTTLTRLLLRFLDVNSGDIIIGGHSIRSAKQTSVRRAISYVPQEPLLFHRSLYENIGYAKPDATHAEIVEAAKKAYAHDFIMQLHDGYETIVGERGVKLSGGQRQRVALARAILKNAPILVLDEATSALDSESEHYIQAALEELMKTRTALVIAHRLSTIQKLDRILVLKDGKVVEDGSHAKLITDGGLYAELWKHQSGGFLED